MKQKMIRLGILDQSPRARNETARDAILNTVRLAQLADNAGYHRFWVAEHHGDDTLSGTSPEILLIHLCSQTRNIRLGTGGILLSHYAPYKVAETYRTIAQLYPGRIDLGIGRSAGGDSLHTALLGTDSGQKPDFARKLKLLLRFTGCSDIKSGKPVWLLSSSGTSAQLASEMGISLSFAHFIDPVKGPSIVQAYRDAYAGNPENREITIAVMAVCAETHEKAEQLATVMAFLLVQNEYGATAGVPTFEEVQSVQLEKEHRMRLQHYLQQIIYGTASETMDRLTELADLYNVEELMIITVTADYADRSASYSLLMEELKKR